MAYIPVQSVVATQSNPSVLQTLTGLMSTNASVITVGTAAANQSVSGTVQADIRGSVATVIIGGSIAASFTPPENQSVSGTVGASIIGSVNINPSSVLILNPVSILAITQSGNVKSSVEGMQAIGAAVASRPVQIGGGDVDGSVIGARFARDGDFITQFHSSVVSLVDNVSNQVAIPVGLNDSGFTAIPTLQYVFDGTTWDRTRGNSANGTLVYGSISGTAGASVIGTVPVTQSGTWSTSVMTNVITSIATAGQVMGSIAALQATNPWITRFANSSIIAINAGSVVALSQGSVINVWQNPSIVGTYQEDSAHTTADRGLFTLAVRNDTVASFAGANSEYSAFATDSAGRTLIKPFAAGEASLIASTSLVSAGTTASVVVFAAPGAGLRNYITDFNISNTSATTTVVRFGDRDRSVLAQTIAPGGGGSNHSYATPVTNPTANLATGVEILSSASVVYVTVAGFKAP